MKILIKNIAEIYTMDNKVIKDGYIIIENNKISEVGSYIYEDNNNYDKIIDAQDMIALPGFVNTHTHSAMTLLRGYADDLPLDKWLKEKIWPLESKLTAEYIYWGTKLALVEMLKTGTTTFADMYFQMHKIAEAVAESGMRAVLSQGLIEENDGQDGLKKAKQFTENWNGEAEGRITTIMGPHATYTCSPDYLEEIAEIAANLNVGITIHVAETKKETEIIKNKYNCSPVKYLEKINLFDVPTIAAHCVHISKEDIQILKNYNVGVSHNPMSNMKLGSGIAPIDDLWENGVNVALGTDGVSSNNNLDMIEEARFASYLQQVKNNNPTVMDIETLLKMLTIKGIEILQLNNLGIIKEGFIADLILINMKNNPVFYPQHNNLSNLIYAAKGYDVSTVIIDGKIIMEEGLIKTLDEKKIYNKVNEIISKLV